MRVHTEMTMEDYIRTYFKNKSIPVSESGHSSYPGSCSVCHMKNQGWKTMIVGLTPTLCIRLCNVCYQTRKNRLHESVEELQCKTGYNLFFSFIESDEKFMIPSGLWYDQGWKVHPHYKVFCRMAGHNYVPVIKDDTVKMIKIEDVLFLNRKIRSLIV